MSLLRIFLAGDGACDWTLQDDRDDRGSPLPAGAEGGENTPYAELPRAARCVAIVPAVRMRTLSVAVPPTPAAKLPSVVRFALEDQLAGDVEAQHVVIAARRESDLVVHVLERRWLQTTLADLARHGVRPTLAAAESDLAPRAPSVLGTWVWRADGGFLIEAGGRVTVLDQSRDALPSGLLLALRNAGNAGHSDAAESPSARVVVRGPPALAERGAAWSRATGVAFDIEPGWTWRDASAATLAAAANLLTSELRAGTSSVLAAEGRPRILRRALMWLLAALLLHAGASAAEWAMLKWRVAQVERDTQQLIRKAAPDLAGDLDAAWRKYYAAARHRQGKSAPGDALPLLAEAAAALTELPPGALRVINFEAGQLTLDFDRSAAQPIAAALPLWQDRGLSVLQAGSPGGVRVRFARQ
jgi:general secretion pathway protein L